MQRIVAIFLSIFLFMAAWGAVMSGQVDVAKTLTAPQMKVLTIVRATKHLSSVSSRSPAAAALTAAPARLACLQAPLYMVMLFGTYSLASIGIGLITFKDCPEESELLQGEIKEAMAELRAKGVYPKSE